MTARETLRSAADSLENFQVVAGRPDWRVAALRELARRIDELGANASKTARDMPAEVYKACALHILGVLDAPLSAPGTPKEKP